MSSTLPRITLTTGLTVDVDLENLRIIPVKGLMQFDDAFAFHDFLAQYEETDGDDVVSRHVFNSYVERIPDEIPLTEKLKYEVYRTQGFVFLLMPPHSEYLRREGYDMRHCLSYLNKSYADRAARGSIELYSMIEEQTGKPVVDIEVSIEEFNGRPIKGNPKVTQVRGVANECPPALQYRPALIAFLCEFGKAHKWEVHHDIRNFDGKIDSALLFKDTPY